LESLSNRSNFIQLTFLISLYSITTNLHPHLHTPLSVIGRINTYEKTQTKNKAEEAKRLKHQEKKALLQSQQANNTNNITNNSSSSPTTPNTNTLGAIAEDPLEQSGDNNSYFPDSSPGKGAPLLSHTHDASIHDEGEGEGEGRGGTGSPVKGVGIGDGAGGVLDSSPASPSSPTLSPEKAPQGLEPESDQEKANNKKLSEKEKKEKRKEGKMKISKQKKEREESRRGVSQSVTVDCSSSGGGVIEEEGEDENGKRCVLFILRLLT
jgi:hypothetical protein